MEVLLGFIISTGILATLTEGCGYNMEVCVKGQAGLVTSCEDFSQYLQCILSLMCYYPGDSVDREMVMATVQELTQACVAHRNTTKNILANGGCESKRFYLDFTDWHLLALTIASSLFTHRLV